MAQFYFESDALSRITKKSIDAAARGLKNGITDVKNDWQADSRDIAPIDKSNLRKQINMEVFTEGDEIGVEATANAIRGGKRPFNYAYYIHEDEGSAVTGEKKFLDIPVKKNQKKWAKWIEAELESELKRAGW